MNADPSDLRRFPRIASPHTVLVKKMGDDSVEEFAQTRTIAQGGCCFLSEEPLGENSLLELLIAVGGRVITAPGRVVYEHDLGDGRSEVGVQFSDRLDEKDAKLIADLFERNGE